MREKSNDNSHSERHSAPRHEPDLHGASLVDENGVETPITEAMITQALDELDAAWEHERERRARANPDRRRWTKTDRRRTVPRHVVPRLRFTS